MILDKIDTVATIKPSEFKEKYYRQNKPVVIKHLSHEWPAFHKWNWDYLKEMAGKEKIGIYNNVKSDAYTPINKADDYTTFGAYIDMIRKGPAAWRIFLFNVFSKAPQMKNDFTWPNELMHGFVKSMPMLFVGGEGAITHMHFDIDLSHILHTQFAGRKRILLFPHKEEYKLYRKPFEVLSMVDFSNYYDVTKSKIDYAKFPALKYAKGYDVILAPGDTLFMPGGYWHHMEYLESGFAMSLRALNTTFLGKLHGVWNLFGMRSIDTLMKKSIPVKWYNWKVEKLNTVAKQAIEEMRAS